MRTRLVGWRSNFYAALGLMVFACGGKSERADDGEGSGGAGGMPGPSCVNPQPVIGIDGQETGFVRCDAGFIHRPERRECASIVPRPDPVVLRSDAGNSCTRDQDCSHKAHGHCSVPHGINSGAPFAYCDTGCIRDEECGTGLICLCGDPVGRCVSASCTVDADCGAGVLCTSVETSGCTGAPYYFTEFACQKPGDQCRGRADCSENQNCAPGNAGRVCQGQGICGRPFLIAGELRQASLVAHRTGWTAEVTPSVAALDPSSRTALAEHWSNNGLMEHASVAAFARFTLELLALGAPASLVRDAQQALGDEIAHAELCFGLASAYAGRTIQPGPLPMDGALDALSFMDIVERAIAEACIGETIAAVEAAEAREYARDPEVRAVLERIAADELRHAKLGFAFLRWVLSTAAPATREQLCRRAASLAEQELERPIDDGRPQLLAHGVLTGELRREVRRAAVSELILPLVHALNEDHQRIGSSTSVVSSSGATFAGSLR